MTLLKIAQIGTPVLRERAREVSREEVGSPEFQQFVDDLVETMRDAQGAGLAAIQVYRAIRVVAIEVGDNPRYPYKPKVPLTILVNPVLTPLSEERFDNYEGCLSVPDLRGVVSRQSHRQGSPRDHGRHLPARGRPPRRQAVRRPRHRPDDLLHLEGIRASPGGRRACQSGEDRGTLGLLSALRRAHAGC
jgi:peptide deformylase